MAITRLGLYGGPRSPYGSFVGKVAEIIVPPIADAVQFGKKFYAQQVKDKRKQLTLQMRREDEEILTLIEIVGKFLL